MKWEDAEIEVLRGMAGHAHASEIAKSVGRSLYAVRMKAFNLGISLLRRAVPPSAPVPPATPPYNKVVDALQKVMRSVPGDNTKHDMGRTRAYEILATNGGGVTGVRDLKPALYDAVIAACEAAVAKPKTALESDLIAAMATLNGAVLWINKIGAPAVEASQKEHALLLRGFKKLSREHERLSEWAMRRGYKYSKLRRAFLDEKADEEAA
jgi:hypothetical protein